MKYSIRYYRGCSAMDDADEIIIKYTERNVNLIDFVQKNYVDKRIVVDISKLEDIDSNLDIFKVANDKHNNLAFLLNLDQIEKIIDFKNNGLKFFFIEGADNFDSFTGLINLGVSDIYIVNELCFSLKQISQFAKEKNVIIRVYPNIAQSSTVLPVNGIKKFFIRPDDMYLYNEYIDICEFYCPLSKQNIYYKIYKDQKWLGTLNELIYNLENDTIIDVTTIVPHFGEARTKCQKRCAYGDCSICDRVIDLAATLKEKGLGLRLDLKHECKIDENVMPDESESTFEYAQELDKEEL